MCCFNTNFDTSAGDLGRFIVVHDTERDYGTGANYGYEHLDATFKHMTEFRRARPYTKVYSNIEPFPVEQCDAEWDRLIP